MGSPERPERSKGAILQAPHPSTGSGCSTFDGSTEASAELSRALAEVRLRMLDKPTFSRVASVDCLRRRGELFLNSSLGSGTRLNAHFDVTPQPTLPQVGFAAPGVRTFARGQLFARHYRPKPQEGEQLHFDLEVGLCIIMCPPGGQGPGDQPAWSCCLAHIIFTSIVRKFERKDEEVQWELCPRSVSLVDGERGGGPTMD